MNTYCAYWRRGWWAWLLMLCTNIACFALLLPVAFATEGHPRVYIVIAVVVLLAVGAPLSGWLFERFSAKAPSLAVQWSRGGEP